MLKKKQPVNIFGCYKISWQSFEAVFACLTPSKCQVVYIQRKYK